MESFKNTIKKYFTLPKNLENKISFKSLRFTDPNEEREYDNFTNNIYHKPLKILVPITLFLDIIWTISGPLFDGGGIILKRDIGAFIECGVTITSLILIYLRKDWGHIVICIFSQLVFCTNNIPKVTGYDTITYDPTSQILLWIMISAPGIKFWRACITSNISILALIVVRFIQRDYSILNIIFVEGASYLVYVVSILINTRTHEIIERELFIEIKQQNPSTPPHEIYFKMSKELSSSTKRFQLRFKIPQIENLFLYYYKNYINIEYGATISILFSSIYYLIQDLQIPDKSTVILFFTLRFGGMVPITLILLYFSFKRKENPYKADIISSGFVMILLGIYMVMFQKSPDFQTSLFYFGGIMRTISFSSAQFLLLPFIAQIVSSLAAVPLSMMIYSDKILSQVLIMGVFCAVVYGWSYNREKKYRLIFLIKENKSQEPINAVPLETINNMIEMKSKEDDLNNLIQAINFVKAQQETASNKSSETSRKSSNSSTNSNSNNSIDN